MHKQSHACAHTPQPPHACVHTLLPCTCLDVRVVWLGDACWYKSPWQPQANHYYKLFITWTNQKILSTFVERNLFDFKHIKVGHEPSPLTLTHTISLTITPSLTPQPFDRSYTDLPGPMVSGWVSCDQSHDIHVTYGPLRLCLLLLECCTRDSPSRSSRSGQGTRRTWQVVLHAPSPLPLPSPLSHSAACPPPPSPPPPPSHSAACPPPPSHTQCCMSPSPSHSTACPAPPPPHTRSAPRACIECVVCLVFR